MNKRYFFQTLIITLLLTVIIVVFFGSFISAKISTWPFLRKFNLLSPQAPIVITRREEVRVSDSGDVQQAVGKVKAKIASVISKNGGKATVLGGALNLTSDGLFLTSKATVANFQKGSFYVLTDSGDPVVIDEVVLDPASNLAFLKASFNNLPVADFTSSRDLNVGQKLVFISHGTVPFTPQIQAGYVTLSQQDLYGLQFHAGFPARSFGAASSGALVPGEAVITTDGFVVGIWDGSSVVSSDVIRDLMDLYLADKDHFVRPAFGFDYTFVNNTQAALLGTTPGAQVSKLQKKDASGRPTAAANAGLLEGDVITQAGDFKITQDKTLEEGLSKVKPGDSVSLRISRGQQTLIVNLTATILK